jgi:hypothetical protein
MIADLDRTLDKWLRQDLPPEVTEKLTISFLPPDQVPNTAVLPAIDLFLYDVRQNLDLRNNEWVVERQPDGKATQKRAPMQVTCFYLISAWASGDAADAAQKEHLILGEILKLLLANPRIPDAYLQGSLLGSSTPVVATPVQTGAQNITDLWAAFGGKPKVALNYSINVGVEIGKPSDGWLVTQKTIQFELVNGGQK